MCAYRGWKPIAGRRASSEATSMTSWMRSRQRSPRAWPEPSRYLQAPGPGLTWGESPKALMCFDAFCFVFWHGQHLSTFICFLILDGHIWDDDLVPGLLISKDLGFWWIWFQMKKNVVNVKDPGFQWFFLMGFAMVKIWVVCNILQRLGKLHYIRFWGDVSSKSGCNQQKRWI